MYRILYSVFISVLLFHEISCHANGAPASQCETMTPQHGVSGQSGVSPFKVKVGKSYYKKGMSVDITIEASGTDKIKGLLLQAREVGKNGVIGTFPNVPTGLKHVDCNSNPKGAVTHNARGSWSYLNMSWSPPDDVSGNISFFATVVKDYNTFWVKLESPHLYKMGSMKSSAAPSTSTSVLPTSMQTPTTTSFLLLSFSLLVAAGNSII